VGIAANAPQPSDEGLGVFTPSLNVSFPDRTEPFSFASAPLPESEPASEDSTFETSGLQPQSDQWSIQGGEDPAHFTAEPPYPLSNIEEVTSEEDSRQPEIISDFTETVTGELLQEEDPAKDAIILSDVPQRKRSRRGPRNAAAETQPADPAAPVASNAEGSSPTGTKPDTEDEPQRRRPRRPTRSRTPRRGGEAEAGLDPQVELGLMEALHSQPQPVNRPLDREEAAQQIFGEAKPDDSPASLRAGDQDLSSGDTAIQGAAHQASESSPENLTSETPASGATPHQPEAANETKPPEPPQPKRSGWWQRAKASIRG
jgi:ribonuclease E